MSSRATVSTPKGCETVARDDIRAGKAQIGNHRERERDRDRDRERERKTTTNYPTGSEDFVRRPVRMHGHLDFPGRAAVQVHDVKQELFLDIAQRIPQGAVSRAWGWLARRQQPRPAVSVLKHLFVRAAGIEMQDAEGSVASYSTLQELFVRSLRPGARIIDPEPSAVVSPVDGCVGACGVVDSGTLLQVKGRSYSLARLLGDPAAAKRFEGGAYATVYLAPKDYHRIHAPVSGAVSAATLIPGRLFPVFPEALRQVDELFARNERIITYLESAATGRLAVVKVGATLVGHISVTYDVALRSNESGEQRPRYLTYDPPRIIQKGAQLGAFELGSTVVVIAERNRITFDTLREGMHVRMGERIGTVAVPATGTAAC